MKRFTRFIILFCFLLCGCRQFNLVENSMKIIHLDCGRKYFSKQSIKELIDEASTSNCTHIELALGNDGLRFLLDDMKLDIDGKIYPSEDIKIGIHKGNEKYCDFEMDELTQDEMDEIIDYANKKDIDIIPLINTPGHMDSILYCLSYNGIDAYFEDSIRTLDIQNKEGLQFTKALLEKYIQYFSSKGCTYFSMGADEYGNDIYSKGSMGFGQLIKRNEYQYFVEYINSLSKLIQSYDMIPMAFNDGIYFQNHTEYPIDTNIVVCFWSYGDIFYRLCPANKLEDYGFQLINTNSKYYFVSNNPKWKCTKEDMKKFEIHSFQGSKVEHPLGSMFCIWCDDPMDESEEVILEQTKEVIEEFGKK